MIECPGNEIVAYGGENDAIAMISKSIYAPLALKKWVRYAERKKKRQTKPSILDPLKITKTTNKKQLIEIIKY